MSTVQPETRYAKSGDVYIAYQVIGEGPLYLMFVPGSDLVFVDRGVRALKGVPGEWHLFAAVR